MLPTPDVRDKMRVAVVSHACVVGVNRAPWVALAEDYPVDLTILAPKRWRTLEGWQHKLDTQNAGPAKIVGLDVLGWGHPNLCWWRGLESALRRLAPDVVFLDEEPYSLTALQILRVRKRLRAALIVYAKQNILKRYPWPFSRAERHILETADWLMAVAEPSKAVLEAKGCRAPITIVPHVIDTALYTPGPAEPLRSQLGLKPPVIGYVGRLVPEKGVKDLLEAAAELQGRGVQFSLLIVGDGPQRPELEKYAAARLGQTAKFVGAVPHGRVPEYYRCMDLLVLPSHDTAGWREQFGRTIIEALACGVPVIGSDAGSIPGVISATAGQIYRQGDVAELAAAIEALLSNPARRQEIVQKGRQRVMENFTAEAVARTLYDIAAKAVERRAQKYR